jgi:hypothetical protein
MLVSLLLRSPTHLSNTTHDSSKRSSRSSAEKTGNAYPLSPQGVNATRSTRVVVSLWRCVVSRRFTEAEIAEVWERPRPRERICADMGGVATDSRDQGERQRPFGVPMSW